MNEPNSNTTKVIVEQILLFPICHNATSRPCSFDEVANTTAVSEPSNVAQPDMFGVEYFR